MAGNIVACLVGLAWLSSTAVAQPVAGTIDTRIATLARIAERPTQPATAPATSQPTESRRSEALAIALSAGSTLAGSIVTGLAVRTDNLAMGVTGASLVLLGPSVGHWYAGSHGGYGLAARLVGSAAAVGGAWSALDCSHRREGEDNCGGLAIVAVGGALLFAGGVFYDIESAHRAIRRANRSTRYIAPEIRDDAAAVVVGGAL